MFIVNLRGERQIGKSYFRRVVCVDVYNVMCETFLLSLVLHIMNVVYIGVGFDLISRCSKSCLGLMRNLELDCDINSRLSSSWCGMC